MKTKKQIEEKDFDTVKTFRAIKEKISKDISGMTLLQIQEYLQEQKPNPQAHNSSVRKVV